MPNIPQFNAQIQQVEVPSLRNFQESQDEQIYKAVAEISDTSSKLARNMYIEEQKHKAKIRGAENVKEQGSDFSLSNLPSPTTEAQASYNESAINSFAAQYTVDTSLALTNLENENRDNPFRFLEKANAYINGTSANIPEYLKPSIVKPLEMNARSIYSSLLKKRVEDGRAESKIRTLLSLQDMIRQIDNTSDAVVQDEMVGQFRDILIRAVSTDDISPELALKYDTEARQGLASKRLLDNLLTETDPKKITETINMVLSGNSDIKALNDLSPQERLSATNEALNKLIGSKGYLGSVAEQAGKYVVNTAQLNMFEQIAGQPAPPKIELKQISAGNKTFYNMMNDAINKKQPDVDTIMNQYLKDSLLNGNLTTKDVFDSYEQKYISGSEAINSLKQLNSPLVQNKNKEAYKQFKSNLDYEMNDITNNIGAVSQKNIKKEYIEKNMEEYLLPTERTDEEIAIYSDAITEKANKAFKQGSEYQKVHTAQWFREQTGYDISAVDVIVGKATINGRLDKKRLRRLLLDITGNDQDEASKLFSMYKAVKNN